jgi:uncharacterized protein (DUF1778 family)
MTDDSQELSKEDRLELWLQAATAGLSDEAASRVREEVTDHVLSAVEDGAGNGLDEMQAGSLAIAALGDPERAGRALRRANLRPWEAKVVGGLKEPQPLWAQVMYWGLIPAFVALNLRNLDSPSKVVLFALCVTGLLGGLAARFYFARRLARAGRLRAALVADVFGPWVYFAALVVGSNLLQKRHTTAAPLTYLVILAAGVVFVAYLWPKLGRRRSAP